MIHLNSKYTISENLIAKKIEGEMVIIPLSGDIGDLNSEMYALNETGIAVWEKLDGNTSVKTILDQLAETYDASRDQLKTDVFSLLEDFLDKGIIFTK